MRYTRWRLGDARCRAGRVAGDVCSVIGGTDEIAPHLDRDRERYGCTWINTHFMLVNEMPHGGLKSSGYGKDLSLYALEDYTVPRHVMVKM